MLGNVTPTVTRTPPRGLRQHKSEVYNTDERARLQAHASEIIASLMKASLFFEDNLRGNAIFLTREGS